MLDYIERYLKSGGDRHIDEIIMAQDVLAEYINIHEDNNFVSEEYETVKKRIYSLIDISLEKKSGRGGIVSVSYTHLDVYKRQLIKGLAFGH